MRIEDLGVAFHPQHDLTNASAAQLPQTQGFACDQVVAYLGSSWLM